MDSSTTQAIIELATVTVGGIIFAAGIIFSKTKKQTRMWLLVAFLVFLLPLVVQAGYVIGSIIKNEPNTLETKTIYPADVVTSIINYVIYCMGISSVIMGIIAMIVLIVKRNDVQIRDRAKKTIIFGVILFVLAIFSYAFMNTPAPSLTY